MEKLSKKETWTVYIDTDITGSMSRLLHTNVVRYYQEDGVLHIEEGRQKIGLRSRSEFTYNLKHVKQIQVRREKKGGFV